MDELGHRGGSNPPEYRSQNVARRNAASAIHPQPEYYNSRLVRRDGQERPGESDL